MIRRSDALESEIRQGTVIAPAVSPDFRTNIAQRMEEQHLLLATRWLDQLKRLLPATPEVTVSGDPLPGHMPALILQLAAFLRAPGDEAIVANTVVTARAAELGQLRHAQRASVHQVLREYHALRAVIGHFTEQETSLLHLTPSVGELFDLTNRLDAAIDVFLKTTVDTFMTRYTQRVSRNTTRLESFCRMVTHELRQPLGTLQFGLRLLAADDTWTTRAKRDRFLATCDRNVARMTETLSKLVALLHTTDGGESALVQRVELSTLVGDVVRQLREMAETRGVNVMFARSLPAITTDVARLELVLVNLISNAIKYSDPHKPHRIVEIHAVLGEGSDVCRIRVRDNGIGIADSQLTSIFGRFHRGHAKMDGELRNSGLGLGLSIVDDCVSALRGDIRVESTLGEGTAFVVEFPVAMAA